MSKQFYTALGKMQTWPKISVHFPSSLAYDDVILVPQVSAITSRSHVDTTVRVGPYQLQKPIICAPMDTISGEVMIRTLANLGAIGTLPRGDLKKRLSLCSKFTKENISCIYAIGLKHAFEEAQHLKKVGAKIVLIDVAHGGLATVKKTAAEIKKKLGLFVIAGNIVTFTQALSYKRTGVDVARVGVGPGGMCKTRLVAGTGFPQLSAIFETTTAGIPVIADGGIREPGHFAKAIAAGAIAVMIGSLFAGTDETPGNVIEGKKKMVRGQASEEYMRDNGIEPGEFRASEGVSLTVPLRGSVKHIIDSLMGGLRSAMTYAGAKTIKEFQKKSIFTIASQAAQDEGRPWLRGMS
ncbi:MAG: guanosine monophosphate reductase [Candidatus Levybacteria bacterium]|nr:guanosine monophosphate reductase [Candidatus Levybacteria bacterium]